MFDRDDLNRKICCVIAVLATVFRLCLSMTQYATIYPPLAPLDDDLMTRAAMSIVSGHWLGEYNCLTLSKHAGFAVWLALLNRLHIPYLLANAVLWSAASFLAARAIAPALKRNWGKLIVYLLLLYNPASWAQYATRIYRDSIFPALCLMFFSGVIGTGLRYKERLKRQIPWMALYGTSFGAVYLSREDGMWVLPFFVVALMVILFLTRSEGLGKTVLRALRMAVPFSIGAVMILLYCMENLKHYGRFIVSDFDSGEFKSAYGAMTSLKQDHWDPYIAVPEDVREDLYREVPMFSPVKEALNDPIIMVGHYDTGLKDFKSGSFYWALRRALQNLGIYDDPQKARDYYIELTNEIQKAVDEGRLQTTDGSANLRKSVTPPIKAEYIQPVLMETFEGMKKTAVFDDCDPLAQTAVGDYQTEILPVERFIRTQAFRTYIEGTDIPYVSPARRIPMGFMRVITSVYRIVMPVFAIITLIWQIKKLISDRTLKRFTITSMANIVLLGLLGMSVLRCAMIAFMEVSSFGIGTYVMYLSSVHPIYILYSATGFAKTTEH
ncbi:MAG: hypothetical protein IJG64_01135 [Oscillospiraceae bacterium]|nr:hypothetical protein [Oscillospiraceae bacterium]